jgi:hypothetical protein
VTGKGQNFLINTKVDDPNAAPISVILNCPSEIDKEAGIGDFYLHERESKPTLRSPNVYVEVNAHHLACHQDETTNRQKRKPATKGIPMVHAVLKCVQTLSELLAAYRAPFSQSV